MEEHIPVLLQEVVDGLETQPDDIVVDLTLGRAGHARRLLTYLKKGHLYGLDQDKTAIAASEARLSAINRNFTLLHANFKDAKKALMEVGVTSVDKVLLDIGVSSPQLDDASRGFSYRSDAPLDMRMDQDNNPLTAAIIVNTYPEEELKRIFYRYAEHPYSALIAKKIVEARSKKEVTTTFDLVEIIKNALPNKELKKKGHPAKTFFQALRIVVNDELGALEQVLEEIPSMLRPGGRLAVISFHSLEDKLVKNKFKSLASDPPSHPLARPEDIKKSDYLLVNRKVITARAEEVTTNPRSESAKLRIIAKRRN